MVKRKTQSPEIANSEKHVIIEDKINSITKY